ncbi:MAG: secretin N-terminal domain-containing protein, partial [Vampirovibrionales bacterium]
MMFPVSFSQSFARWTHLVSQMQGYRPVAVLLLLLTLLQGGLLLLPTKVQAFGETPVSLFQKVSVVNGDQMLSMESNQEDVRQVIRQLAQSTNLNLMLDPSVRGTLSITLNNVTLNEALEAILTSNDLVMIPKEGNIYVIMSRQTAIQRGIDRQYSKLIPLKYVNAQRIANLLNNTVFQQPQAGQDDANAQGGDPTAGGGGDTGVPITSRAQADFRTNAVLIIGEPQDIDIATQVIASMDVRRESKTFFLSYANAGQVASLLMSSIFNEGVNPLQLGGAAAGGGAAAPAGGGGEGS